MSWRSIGRKWRKFRASPWAFLADSRTPGLRAISRGLQTLLPSRFGLDGLRRHPDFDPSFYRRGEHLAATEQAIDGWSVEQDLSQLRITIVVVVSDSSADLEACVQSVLAHTNFPHAELLLIDDATTEPATPHLLKTLASSAKLRVLRNPEPLGLAGSLQRALEQAAERDVVHVRSDATVGLGWLRALAAAAYGAERLAERSGGAVYLRHGVSTPAELPKAESGLKPASSKPRLLFVVSTLGGGTPLSNEDLMHGVAAHYAPLLLVSDARELRLFDCAGASVRLLMRHELEEQVPFWPHVSAEYDRVVAAWLLRFGVELVHVRHIAWHGQGLVSVARSLCIPTLFSFHDFYAVCPSVNLSDGVRPVAFDGVQSPPLLAPLWQRRRAVDASVATALDGDAKAFSELWKSRMNAMLSGCAAFITTSPSVHTILSRNLPVLRERGSHFHVIPHGRDFSALRAPKQSAPRRDRALRVLVLGNISQIKGAATLAELLRLDTQQSIELHTLGKISDLLQSARGTHHGPYARDEVLKRIEAIAPDVALIPTTVPETFCHALTECWAAGLPVVGSELGAVGERIRETGAGWSVNPHDAAGILDLLLRIRDGKEDWAVRARAVTAWQSGAGATNTVAAMSARYLELYRQVAERQRSLSPPDLEHAADGQDVAGLG